MDVTLVNEPELAALILADGTQSRPLDPTWTAAFSEVMRRLTLEHRAFLKKVLTFLCHHLNFTKELDVGPSRPVACVIVPRLAVAGWDRSRHRLANNKSFLSLPCFRGACRSWCMPLKPAGDLMSHVRRG